MHELQVEHFTVKRWTIWRGSFYNTYQRLDKAPVFSPNNQYFVATLLNNMQISTLSRKLRTSEPFTITFDSWEAMNEVKLRVCCDDICTPSTFDKSHQKINRTWRRLSLRCPRNIHKVSFECINFGNRRGACGIDNFMLKSNSCTEETLSFFII
ncbi:hypothetical protein DICVIV_08330 [Dictyocaulus viviparus]|uniref:Uncharacterized protein n=1 Tax=Dictyocaulus viviparus TaxID=29172 RepID=A0A0D8XP93_DICVI|nr:hypothetical protein DICVIV_08330 [Dictyocaulus viviparus]